MRRPEITEEPIGTPRPCRSGNKVVCDGRCMCQPENHEGKGACGRRV